MISFVGQSELNNSEAVLPAITIPQGQTLTNTIITEEEIKSTLLALKSGKSSGSDKINNRILKELTIPLSKPLCSLFNISFVKGIFPNVWKHASVTPLYKKDDPSLVCNYRPISLLGTVGKTLEKIIHKHIFFFKTTI